MADSEETTEVARQKVDAQTLQMGAPERIGKEALRGIESFDDAVQLAASVHGAVQDYAEQYGSGFDIVDKAIFVNKTIVLLEWRFADGDYGDKFVIATAVAKDGSKGIITDGSTGLCRELQQLSFVDGIYGGITVRKGLRVSDYDTCKCGLPRKETEAECESCGDNSTERGKGRTYYLDESLS